MLKIERWGVCNRGGSKILYKPGRFTALKNIEDESKAAIANYRSKAVAEGIIKLRYAREQEKYAGTDDELIAFPIYLKLDLPNFICASTNPEGIDF